MKFSQISQYATDGSFLSSFFAISHKQESDSESIFYDFWTNFGKIVQCANLF